MTNLVATAQIIRNLFKKADSTASPHEATSLRAKGRELMRRYHIDQHVLDRPGEGLAVSQSAAIERKLREALNAKDRTEPERRAIVEYLERRLMGYPVDMADPFLRRILF